MPEISRFRGLIIRMYYDDSSQHHKPNVHVFSGGDEAEVGIDGEMLAGRLPQKQYKLLAAWLILHEDELYRAWNLAVSNRRFDRIDPLH